MPLCKLCDVLLTDRQTRISCSLDEHSPAFIHLQHLAAFKVMECCIPVHSVMMAATSGFPPGAQMSVTVMAARWLKALAQLILNDALHDARVQVFVLLLLRRRTLLLPDSQEV